LENIKFDLVEAVNQVCGHKVLMCAELLATFTREESPCTLCLDADAEKKVLTSFRTGAGTYFHGVTVGTRDAAGLYRHRWGRPCLYAYLCGDCDHAALTERLRQREVNRLAHLAWKRSERKMASKRVDAGVLHKRMDEAMKNIKQSVIIATRQDLIPAPQSASLNEQLCNLNSTLVIAFPVPEKKASGATLPF
jgi:hypothetical protein